MCGGGGGGSAAPDYSVQRRQVALSRELENDYMARFLPYERQLVTQAMNKGLVAQDAQAASELAGRAFDATAGQSERQLAGFGKPLTAAQQQAHNASRQRSRNATTMGASDSARQQSANRFGQLRSSLMGLGRRAQQQGLSGIKQAGTMEKQRNITNQQNAAQSQGNGWGLAGIGLGMATSYMVSDKNKKQNIQPRNDQQDMADARSFNNYDYDYKPGQSGGRAEYGHVGGMAQEMPPSMSDGKQVDLGDATMVAFGAIRNMDKRLRQLEGNAATKGSEA